MSIAKQVVNKPVTIFIIFCLIVGLAAFTVVQIPIDLFPDVKFPMVVVYTIYEGAGPEQVEKVVTRPLEGALSNVSNLEKIQSRSMKGASMIMLEFGWGQDLGEASNEVRDKLELVKQYMPDEVQTPQIFKFDPSMIPIMEISIQSDRPVEELLTMTENRIVPNLEQVPGVAMATIYGGKEKAIRVEISQNRLDAYGLSLSQVAQMLAAQNIQFSSGQVAEGSRMWLVETSGEFSTIEEIKNTVVAYKGGMALPGQQINPSKVVLLRDIAEVREGYKDVTSNVYVDSQPAIDISLQRRSGTNSVKTANLVHKELAEIRKNLPPDVKLEVVFDTTDMIRDSIRAVGESALMGGLLAMLILFLFLRNWKSTAIIGFSIPISLLVTMMVMYFMNLTLNLMTLAGLTLGVGMIVDASIVVLENIYRYREKGTKLKPSAILGTQEMMTAISASTLTTICVFLPMVLFKKELGLVGVLFQDMALTVVVSLTVSLVVAMTLVPVLSSRFLRIYTRQQRPIQSERLARVDSVFERFFVSLDTLYKKILGFLLKNKGWTIGIMVLLFAISCVAIPLLGMDFMPSSGEPFVQVSVSLPVGTKLEVTEAVMDQVVQIVQTEVQGYRQIFVVSGRGSGWFNAENTHKAELTVSLPDFKDRIDDKKTVEEKLRAHFDEFPGVEFAFSGGMMGPGNQYPIDIILKTEDMDNAIAKGEEIVAILEQHVPAVTEPFVDVEDGLPTIEIKIDRQKAYALGLNIMTIGSEVSAAIDGKVATVFRNEGNEYDVIIELPEADRDSIPDLNNIFITSGMGQRVPVASFASLEKGESPTTILREDRVRTVHIKAGLKPGYNTNLADGLVRAAIGKHYIPDDTVVLEYGGDFKELADIMIKFVLILLLSVALVFGVMASQFESLKDPFIVFLSMPFLVVGIVALYAITGTSITAFTAVGVVMLVGIVVNNGIVLVDYTNLMRARGLSIYDACIEAGGNRLRPVLMTSLTTILGMAPMAFARGEGTDYTQPIGQAILGGMTVSTLFTLLIVPLFYAVFNRKKVPRKLKSLKIQSGRESALAAGEYPAAEIHAAEAELRKYYHEIPERDILRRNSNVSDDDRSVIWTKLVEIHYGRYARYRHR
jgi:HAE1 family hydrophobic/amphiphilic exporter-1